MWQIENLELWHRNLVFSVNMLRSRRWQQWNASLSQTPWKKKKVALRQTGNIFILCSLLTERRHTERQELLSLQSGDFNWERTDTGRRFWVIKCWRSKMLQSGKTHKVKVTEATLCSREGTHSWRPVLTCCLLCFQFHSEKTWLPDQRRISAVRSVRTSLGILLSCHAATASVRAAWIVGGQTKQHVSVQFVRQDLPKVNHLLVWW